MWQPEQSRFIGKLMRIMWLLICLDGRFHKSDKSEHSSVGRAFDCSGYHGNQMATGSIPVARIFYSLGSKLLSCKATIAIV